MLIVPIICGFFALRHMMLWVEQGFDPGTQGFDPGTWHKKQTFLASGVLVLCVLRGDSRQWWVSPIRAWNCAPPPVKSATLTDPSFFSVRTSRFPPPGPRSPAISSPRNISARPASPLVSSPSRKIPCRAGCGPMSPIRKPSQSSTRASGTDRKNPPPMCSTVWRAPGPIGAGRPDISTLRPTPRPITTKCATC